MAVFVLLAYFAICAVCVIAIAGALQLTIFGIWRLVDPTFTWRHLQDRDGVFGLTIVAAIGIALVLAVQFI